MFENLFLYVLQLLCGDVSESGGLGVCSAEDGSLWVWDPANGETRVGAYTCIIVHCVLYSQQIFAGKISNPATVALQKY